MKLLFTDLDGTLLSRNKKISSENLEAISRASRQGNIDGYLYRTFPVFRPSLHRRTGLCTKAMLRRYL